jgi:hypothetical protein
MISISYGPSGQSALFTYVIVEGRAHDFHYELTSHDGKTIASANLQESSTLAELAKGLFEEFSHFATNSQSKAMVSGLVKELKIKFSNGSFEQTVGLTASDETLTGFISSSDRIRALFGKLSADKPKMYRLWNEPGPLKAFMPETKKQ